MEKYKLSYKILICALPFAAMPALYFVADFVLHNIPLPHCITYTVLRINCPGCGLTRSVYALTKGDILLSLRQNALLILGMLVCAAYYAEIVFRAFGKKLRIPLLHNIKTLWVFLAILAVYSVLRNVFPAIAPI